MSMKLNANFQNKVYRLITVLNVNLKHNSYNCLYSMLYTTLLLYPNISYILIYSGNEGSNDAEGQYYS